MKTLVFAIVFTALSFINASILYYHQSKCDMWLPRTEEGKWREWVVSLRIESEKRRMAQALGSEYDDLSVEQQQKIDRAVKEICSDDVIARMNANNAFLSYVQLFGLWQWPLTLLASVLCCVALVVNRKRFLFITIAITLVSFALLADAAYRCYFGALGS